MSTKELMIKLLRKKAKGYAYHERTDEYTVEGGAKTLVRSKTVTKRMHPDVNAIRALVELDNAPDITQMTDEQLQVEKLRLIRLLEGVDSPPPDDPT